MTSAHRHERIPLISAGLALGIGMGGFIDGILFHQLLQLHNMLSARYPTRAGPPETLIVNLEVNMFWDGLFHLFCWITTVAGLALFWKAVKQPGAILDSRDYMGSLLMGWGLFNLIEGLIDHHILHVHHVVEGPGHLIWDLAFLLSGMILIVLGWVCMQTGRRFQRDGEHGKATIKQFEG